MYIVNTITKKYKDKNKILEGQANGNVSPADIVGRHLVIIQ